MILADRIVAHAVFSFEENGVARLAVRGELVTVTAETVERYEPLGVFYSAMPDPTAAKSVWAAYAERNGVDTADMTKQELIDAIRVSQKGLDT